MKTKKQNYVWMMISHDELELPLAIAESANELAKMLGVDKHTIISSYNKYKHGLKSFSRYIKVDLDD